LRVALGTKTRSARQKKEYMNRNKADVCVARKGKSIEGASHALWTWNRVQGHRFICVAHSGEGTDRMIKE